MDAKTRDALKRSFEKWDRYSRVADFVEFGEATSNMGPCSCPLCVIFHPFQRDIGQQWRVFGCGDCPVALAGHTLCDETPYVAAETAGDENDIEGFREAARAEAAFLRSLLPEDAA